MGGFRRNVLEFICDNVDAVCKAAERLRVGVVGDGRPVHDIEGRRIAIGCEDMTLEAEPRRCQRQHSPKLPAAKDADRGSGLESAHEHVHALESLGTSATSAVWRSRQASRRLSSAGSLSANTLAASSAALIAPACPMASVPTGMPGGICTIE